MKPKTAACSDYPLQDQESLAIGFFKAMDSSYVGVVE
jgi:hypothetical protein